MEKNSKSIKEIKNGKMANKIKTKHKKMAKNNTKNG